MKMSSRFGFAQLILVFVVNGLCATASLAELAESVAPDFTLKSNAGENLKLSEFRGDVVMINFWASWCFPCRGEHPALTAAARPLPHYRQQSWLVLQNGRALARGVWPSQPISVPVTDH